MVLLMKIIIWTPSLISVLKVVKDLICKVVPVHKHHAMKTKSGSGDITTCIIILGTRWK
jgi:hypothetical protein